MMDRRIHIWNILHDGEITAIAGEQSETLTMFVSIPYIRRRLEPLGDGFVLALIGLRLLEFRDFEGNVTSLREELDAGGPEIVSTESEAMPVKVETTMGCLIVDFESIRFALDTGQEIAFEVIQKACVEYWTEWKARAE